MPVADNTYFRRLPELLKQLCLRVDSPEELLLPCLAQYNCYMLIRTARDTRILCVILSEPYPMTPEEWVETVMSSHDYRGWRCGNMIEIDRKVI